MGPEHLPKSKPRPETEPDPKAQLSAAKANRQRRLTTEERLCALEAKAGLKADVVE